MRCFMAALVKKFTYILDDTFRMFNLVHCESSFVCFLNWDFERRLHFACCGYYWDGYPHRHAAGGNSHPTFDG